jgi:uncharacterized lipoprotein YehR (DUF1307 family)
MLLNQSTIQEGHKLKIEFLGTVKITYATDLYGLLSKIYEKFEESKGLQFKIEYHDGEDRINVNNNGDFQEAFSSQDPTKVVKFYAVEDPNGPFNFKET